MSVGPPPSDEPQKRRPTYRGVIQQDVTRGVERVRRWPRRRPSKPPQAVADNLEKFRQIQKAWQYYTPDGHPWVLSQVEGTPLLPRDVWTMMMSNRLFQITLDDGTELWPMPARTDVSEALDVLGREPGLTLVRGENFWETVQGGGGGGSGLGTRLIADNLLFEDGTAAEWTLNQFTLVTNQSGLLPWVNSHFISANAGGVPRSFERRLDLTTQFTNSQLDSQPVLTLSAIIGSWGNDEDYVLMTLQPLDATDAAIGNPLEFRNVLRPDTVTQWTTVQQIVPLPSGTRKLDLTGSAVRTLGTSANVAFQGIMGWLAT